MDGEDMDKPMTPREILSKTEWEGGWHEVFFWGLKPTDTDDPELAEMIFEARQAYEEFIETSERLERALEEKAGPEVFVDEC